MRLRCRVCHEIWTAKGEKIPDRCNGEGRHAKKNIERYRDPEHPLMDPQMDRQGSRRAPGLSVREGREIVLDPDTAATLVGNPASLEVFLRRVEAMGFRFEHAVATQIPGPVDKGAATGDAENKGTEGGAVKNSDAVSASGES